MLLLVLISVVPCLFGAVNNILVLKSLYVSTIISIALLILWFLLGRWSVKTQQRYLSSVLAVHASGIVLILIILWQFYAVEESARNMTVCALSQCYMESILLIVAKVANKMGISGTSILLLHVISLVILVFTYSCGFISNRCFHYDKT